MEYEESEIKFIHKCVKYFKKHNKSIIHDSEGLIWYPKRDLGIEKDIFVQMCESILNKAQKSNLTYEDIFKWRTWDCFDIAVIDIKLTIAKLEDNHYSIVFDYVHNY